MKKKVIVMKIWKFLTNFGLISAIAVSLIAAGSLTAEAKNILRAGERLMPGQQLEKGPYVFVMQQDGNLVLYKNGKPLWASNTDGRAVQNLIMQNDGNLVMYGYNNKPVWASGTNGKDGAYLILQSDGNVVIYYIPPVQPVWDTGTYNR